MKSTILMNIVGGMAIVGLSISGCGDDENSTTNGPDNTPPPPITNIHLTPSSPATLVGWDTVKASFDYNGMPAGGGRVFVYPFPRTTWSGSIVYPEGDSSGSSWVLVRPQVAPGQVDSLVFDMTDVSLVTLYDTTLYVDYEWIEPLPIMNIQLTPPSPATLMGGDTVYVTFDYYDLPTDGAHIFAQPSPLIRWSGSPLYAEGDGSGRGWMMVLNQSTPEQVNSLVFKIMDTAFTTLYDTTLFVDYEWTARAPTVSNIQLTPPSPATLAGGDKVNMTFDYADLPVGGGKVYVFGIPATLWSGSPLYPAGDGSGASWVRIDAQSVPGHVDSLKFMITDEPGNTLNEIVLPVDYNWQ